MRISDWSSDVCSSDLEGAALIHRQQEHADRAAALCDRYRAAESAHAIDRKRLDQRREHGWRGEQDRRFALEDRSSRAGLRSEEHRSGLTSLMRNSYPVFCVKKEIEQEIGRAHV